MKKVWFFLRVAIALSLFGATAFVAATNYSYLFAKTVSGTIEAVERVSNPATILTTGAQIPSNQFSFAVAIRSDSGEILTASSEDRQWAVAQKGQCVRAKYFPYPPWDLSKGGTFFGARLLKLWECAGK